MVPLPRSLGALSWNFNCSYRVLGIKVWMLCIMWQMWASDPSLLIEISLRENAFSCLFTEKQRSAKYNGGFLLSFLFILIGL